MTIAVPRTGPHHRDKLAAPDLKMEIVQHGLDSEDTVVLLDHVRQVNCRIHTSTRLQRDDLPTPASCGRRRSRGWCCSTVVRSCVRPSNVPSPRRTILPAEAALGSCAIVTHAIRYWRAASQ